MKELISKIPISTVLITYLFICGLLYLIGFWGTFNVDVFNLITVYDIPKSFVFPLLISQGFFTIQFFTGSVMNLNDNRENIEYLVTIKDEWPSWRQGLMRALTSTTLLTTEIFLISSILTEDKFHNELFWWINSLVIGYFLLHRFMNIKEIKQLVKSSILRSYIGHMLVIFPITCFSTGKIISLKVYNNTNIVGVITVNDKLTALSNDTVQVKFLGFISDNFIYSTLDNKKTYIINKTSVEGIILTRK